MMKVIRCAYLNVLCLIICSSKTQMYHQNVMIASSNATYPVENYEFAQNVERFLQK